MAKYTVHYSYFRASTPNSGTQSSTTVTAESEAGAIEIVKGKHSGLQVSIMRVEKK